MDIGAYMQIDDLMEIAASNGLGSFPRLRGLRLMSNEEAVTEDEIKSIIERSFIHVYEDAVCSHFNFNIYEWSSAIRRLRKKYLILDEDGYATGMRWEKIHGKRRKAVKFRLKKAERKTRTQYEMFNKYAGRNDVLYIHSRTGGGNWPSYREEIMALPGLLDHVDDWYDGTYADYYYQIKPVEKGEQDDT